MPLTESDISRILSGGPSNTQTSLSLGGEPSSQPIISGRLFDDVSEDDAIIGRIDYRCFYLANDNDTETYYSVKAYIASQVAGGSQAAIGFKFQNDVQLITVSGGTNLSGGSFVLTYVDTPLTIFWNTANVNSLATQIQTALNSIENLEEVSVTGATTGTTVFFTVEFGGTAGFRFHELLTTDDSNLTPSSTATVSVSKSLDGGPINSVAVEIDSAITSPSGVTFTSPSNLTPVTIGDLRPNDVVPIWIRRTTSPDTEAIEDDGFTVEFKGGTRG